MYQLRWYQSESVAATWLHLCHQAGNPVIVLPTGAGKSLVIADLCREAVQKYRGRVIVLAHRKELLEQNAEKIRVLLPDMDIGIYSAGLRSRDTDHDIIVGGIQSVWSKSHEFGSRQLVLIDEAHLVPRDGEGMYRTFLESLRSINPRLRLVGLTATPYRLDCGPLCRADALFQTICYSAPVKRLIEDGFLCALTSSAAASSVDTSHLKLRGGEFVSQDAERAFDAAAVVNAACREIAIKTTGRKSILVFCSGVQHAAHVAAQLAHITGDAVDVVTGETPPLERQSILTSFKKQYVRFLCNVDVLTTGFDAPCIDAIAVLRATMSPGLFAQMCGRGFRIHESKQDCVAEGQRVLTDHGLIPIELVTKSMKVWDGVEFVNHCGIVFRGKRNVISYAGLTATEDHNVWTKKGWMSLGECYRSKIEICVTGNGELPLMEADCNFRGRDPNRKKESPIFNDQMQRMRADGTEELGQHQSGDRRMQKMREETQFEQTVSWCAEMAVNEMHISQRQVQQHQELVIQKLRRERNQVCVCKSKPYGSMDNGQSRTRQEQGDRPDRQQRKLSTWKPQIGYAETEHEQPEKELAHTKNAQIQTSLSARKICGLDDHKSSFQRNGIQGNRGEVFQEVKQAERRVWDILNCGPRHRFTCEGLLVSNCLVLDFGENIKRHGSLDMPNYGMDEPKKGDGNAPQKTCPNCEADCPLNAKECEECGWIFPASESDGKIKARHNATSSDGESVLSTPRRWIVEEITMHVHRKKDSPTRTLRVDYLCLPIESKGGNLEFQKISEWVCIEHDGYARTKAAKWWRSMSKSPFPEDIEDAIDLWKRGAVAAVSHIETIRDSRFLRVVKHEHDGIPESWDEDLVEVDFETDDADIPF